MDGWVRAGFEDVARVFRRQLRRTTGGAAVAVYYRGELVADLWGGRRTEGQPWQRDTLAMCFSTTKGVVSTALHLLADRGQIEYDAPVAAYWPEFAQGGKELVTVRHVLTHSAGLHRMRTLVDHAQQMLDWEYMVTALERAEPAYEPGTRYGYHALTYGWLAGELIRRVSGRPVARFVERGDRPPARPRRAVCRVPARSSATGSRRWLPWPLPLGRRLGLRTGRGAGRPGWAGSRRCCGCRSTRAGSSTRCCRAGIEDVLWGPEVMDAEIPAANGFFTARSLAKLYAAAGPWRRDRRRAAAVAGGPCEQVAVDALARARPRPGPAHGLAARLPQRLHHAGHACPARSATSASAGPAGGPTRGATWRWRWCATAAPARRSATCAWRSSAPRSTALRAVRR